MMGWIELGMLGVLVVIVFLLVREVIGWYFKVNLIVLALEELVRLGKEEAFRQERWFAKMIAESSVMTREEYAKKSEEMFDEAEEGM